MPWGTGAITTPTDVSSGFSSLGIQSVIDSGELKSDFSTLAGNGQLRKLQFWYI
jgi:hypothetical protein